MFEVAVAEDVNKTPECALNKCSLNLTARRWFEALIAENVNKTTWYTLKKCT